MKILSEISKSLLQGKHEDKLIHAIQEEFVLKHLDAPIKSSQAICSICGGNSGFVCLIEPTLSDKLMWFCENTVCLTKVRLSRGKVCPTLPLKKRSIEWTLFCEFNDIGDIHHKVKFEKIEQAAAKIDYLLEFSKKPSGIILMQGEPGTGKSYASMGVCELFTRNNSSAMFSTQSKMVSRWMQEDKAKYIHSLETCSLLVVDDFGTGEPSPGFMRFFLDLINTRIQWTTRGTIISTNLNDNKFGQFCGEALTDRINMGQKFEFKNKSRRKQTIL